ncbi:MAG: immune inhibitor A [Caldilineaceae bacterium]|nr:immune inhibitor A [Caldilineaceae bacterium]
MKRLTSRLFIILSLLLSAALLFGCGSNGDLLLASRPAATSTPASGESSAAQPAATGRDADATTAPSAQADADTAPPLTGEELSSLSTEAQLALAIVPQRNLRELALRLNPERDEIPLVVNDAAPDYPVGTVASFWVHNLQTNRNFQIMAELVHKNAVAYAWVEVDRPYDKDKIAASIDQFGTVSYPAEVALFGGEWNPGVDNDPRLHVLHATGMGSGVAGYYSSADEYSRLANDFSNEKEMFYISLDWLNATRDYHTYETVLAHEFQHMMHWYRDRNEETWINEGLSEYAQEVAGYPPDTTFARTFALEPDTQLNTWRESNQSNAEHYGSAYLFVAYLAQRFGSDFMAALVAHPANGLTGLNATLSDLGIDETAGALFGDWIVANYADDPNALGEDGVYGYRHLEQRAPRLEADVTSLPADFAATVNNYAVDYYAVSTAGNVAIDFTGETATSLAETSPYSGEHAWWSNRTDDSDARLTRAFDFSSLEPDTPIELEATIWWDIESDYDYGYVTASVDGQKWQILPGQSTTTENPSGNSFGHAYTGASAGWITERYDLSDYAGEDVQVRFEYVTDDAVNRAGWFVDDLAIPAIGYATDFENGPDGWESEGWLLIDNRLTQRWLLQLLEFEDNRLVSVQDVPVDESGHANVSVENLGNGRTATLAVSALAPVTTEPASYELKMTNGE